MTAGCLPASWMTCLRLATKSRLQAAMSTLKESALEPTTRPTRPFLPSFFLNISLSVPGGFNLSSAVESAEARPRAQNPRVGRARMRRVHVHGGVHLSRDYPVELA